MDTFLAVIVAGMMFLFAFRIASAILKSEIFWIFIGLVIVIGFFSDKNDVTNIPDSQDSSIYSSSGDNYIKASGVLEYVPQCFSAARDIKVQILDFKMLGGVAKVTGVENGKEMWTTAESLVNK